MKHLLITTIAAVLLVGCGESQSPEPPTGKAPDILLIEAAAKGNIEAVKQHLAAGVDVNAKEEDGSTPLHQAASEGHKEIAELLIKEGADVNPRILFGGQQGMTPLDWAIRRKRTEIAVLLRKHGGKTGKELKAEGK